MSHLGTVSQCQRNKDLLIGKSFVCRRHGWCTAPSAELIRCFAVCFFDTHQHRYINTFIVSSSFIPLSVRPPAERDTPGWHTHHTNAIQRVAAGRAHKEPTSLGRRRAREKRATDRQSDRQSAARCGMCHNQQSSKEYSSTPAVLRSTNDSNATC